MKKILFVLLAVSCSFAINAQKGKAKKATNKVVKTEAVAVAAPLAKDPTIFLPTEVIDYGEIKKGVDGTKEIEVVNKGAQPLLLTNCNGSCGCTVPTCPREPILPGKSAKISVKYDTNRVGPINKIVTIMSNDPANPTKTISVKGTVVE